MINISNEEIKKLEYIDSGTFGTVYKKDDNTAYKIYHDKIKNCIKELSYNPALTASKLHYNLLIKRRNEIKKSDLIRDLIYVNNEFKGVIIPYYEGKELCDTKLSYKDKIKVSRELLQIVKELNEHLIYPTDIKSNNILVVNNDIKLIDLDDVRTHAFLYPSPLFSSFSRSSLANTIYKLMEKDHYPVLYEAYKKLDKTKPKHSYTFDSIEKYINEMEKDKMVIFIDKNTDINTLKDNTSTYQEHLVYVLDKDEQFKENKIIKRLKLYQIPLYDFTIVEQKDRYIDIEPIKEAYAYQGNEMKLVYKK